MPNPRPDGDSLFYRDPDYLDSADALPRRPAPADLPLYGADHLAREADLHQILHAPPPRHSTALRHCAPIVERDDGSLMALWDATLHLEPRLLERHLLAVGRNGCGKTSELILPLCADQLRHQARSIVLFDVKGELLDPVDRLARAAGRAPGDVLRLDLTQPAQSVGWNPAAVATDRRRALDLALHVCRAADQGYGKRGSSNESPFWIQTSTDLVAGILLALHADANEVPGLARVREILDLPADRFMRWFQEHGDHPGLSRFRAFLATESHNAHTARTDAANRLLTFLDDDLAAVMSNDELRLERLLERPTVLVVVVPEADIERLRPLFNLLVQRIFAALVGEGAGTRPVTLFLDEFASALGRLPDFEIRLNTLRSRRVSVIAATQNLAQIQHLYGDAAGPVLAGFASKVFFAGQEPDDADYASRHSGVMTAFEVTDHESLPRPDAADGNSPRRPPRDSETRDSETRDPETRDAEYGGHRRPWRPGPRSRVPRPRRVLEPSEIDRPPLHFEYGSAVTMLLADLPAFQCWLEPAWRSDELGPAVRAPADPQRWRRRVPLVWLPGDVGSRQQRRAAQRILQRAVGLENAGPQTRGRWDQACATLRPDELTQVLRGMRELDIDVGAMLGLAIDCGSTYPPAVLAWARFQTACRQAQERLPQTGLLPFEPPHSQDETPHGDGDDEQRCDGEFEDGDVPF